jgi:hypothetical protein
MIGVRPTDTRRRTMRTDPPERLRGTRRSAVGAAIALLAIPAVLSGCDDAPTIDLDGVREQVEAGADDALASADDVREQIEGAGLDDEVRRSLDAAVGAASAAVDEARAAVEARADDAGPAAEQAVADARQGLEDAKARLDEVATRTEGAVRRAVDALRDQVQRLADEIDGA